MKVISKRVLSLLLAVSLVFSLITTVVAVEAPVTTKTITNDLVVAATDLTVTKNDQEQAGFIYLYVNQNIELGAFKVTAKLDNSENNTITDKIALGNIVSTIDNCTLTDSNSLASWFTTTQIGAVYPTYDSSLLGYSLLKIPVTIYGGVEGKFPVNFEVAYLTDYVEEEDYTLNSDTVTATIEVKAPSAPYEIFYTTVESTEDKLNGEEGASGEDKYTEYAYDNAEDATTPVTAKIWLVSNDADMTLQAYDIYFEYDEKLTYVSKDLDGVEYKADKKLVHIQAVGEKDAEPGQKALDPVALEKGTAIELGTVTFSINSDAVFAEQLEISMDCRAADSTTGADDVTNISLAAGIDDTTKNTKATGDTTSYYPVFREDTLGVQVNNEYVIRYNANAGTEEIEVPVEGSKKHNIAYDLSYTVGERDGYTFLGWDTDPNATTPTYPKDGTVKYTANVGAEGDDPLLYAIWDRDTVTVTWHDANGDPIEGDNGTTIVNKGEEAVYSGETPTKADTDQYTYLFSGWNTNPKATEKLDNLTVTEDTDFYPIFSSTVRTYTVTWYNQDGSEPLETDENVAYGTQPEYNSDEPVKAETAQYSYEFAGWATSANQTSGTDVGNLPAVSGETKYYAAFSETLRDYTVTFSTEYGTAPNAQTIKYGATANNPGNLSEEHYDFGGWYTDNTYATVFDFENTPITEATTVYAKWTPKTYFVTFNSNGGTGTMEPQEFTYNVSAALNTNAFVKTGYTFAGWTTNSDGTGTTYGNGADITLVGDITLYAKWSENPHTIEVVNNKDGKVEASVYSAKEGDVITLTNTPNGGYEFVSYTVVDENSNTVTETNGQFTMPNASVTVSATFKAKDLTVKVDSAANGTLNIENGETDVAEKTNAHVGDTITLNVVPNTGYKVKSVTFVKSDDDTAVAENAAAGANNTYTFTMPAYGVTVKAEFEAISYTIAFDGNGHTSGSMNNITGVKYDADQKLTKNVFTKNGYNFAGWLYNDTTYADEATVKNLIAVDGETVTLVAQWTAATYNVTLNTDGGTINSGNVTEYTHGTEATLPTKDNITKNGYDFGGWYAKEDLSGDEVKVIGTEEYGDKEFWAKWTPSKYDITFDTDGGSFDDEYKAPEDYTYGDGLATLPDKEVITKDGYTFVGWLDQDGNPIDKIETDATGEVTLTAQWEATPYEITFDLAEGKWPEGKEVTDNKMSYTIDKDINLPEPEKQYYVFTGWKVTEVDETEGNWDTTAEITKENLTVAAGRFGHVTLTAQWVRAATPVVEEYKYAYTGYRMLRVSANALVDDETGAVVGEYQFAGQSMYFTEDPNYKLNDADAGVFYTLVSEQYIDGDTLNKDGYDLLTIKSDATQKALYQEGDVRGDINGDKVVNIADANVVFQMIDQGTKGGYYTEAQLGVEARLKADMITEKFNGDHRGSILDVNAIIEIING